MRHGKACLKAAELHTLIMFQQWKISVCRLLALKKEKG